MIEKKTIVIILLQSTVFFTSPIKPWRCAADVFGAVIVAKPDFIFEQLQTTQLLHQRTAETNAEEHHVSNAIAHT